MSIGVCCNNNTEIKPVPHEKLKSPTLLYLTLLDDPWHFFASLLNLDLQPITVSPCLDDTKSKLSVAANLVRLNLPKSA